VFTLGWRRSTDCTYQQERPGGRGGRREEQKLASRSGEMEIPSIIRASAGPRGPGWGEEARGAAAAAAPSPHPAPPRAAAPTRKRKRRGRPLTLRRCTHEGGRGEGGGSGQGGAGGGTSAHWLGHQDVCGRGGGGCGSESPCEECGGGDRGNNEQENTVVGERRNLFRSCAGRVRNQMSVEGGKQKP